MQFLLATLFVLMSACNRDEALAKRVTGTWTWNPRGVLPPHKIQNTAWPTPSLESYRFNADGTYVHVQRIPGWDDMSNGKTIHFPEEWHEWKGTWIVSAGKLEMTTGPESDFWVAKLRADGWVVEGDTSKVGDGLTYKIDDVTKKHLKLIAVAIGDNDRDLHTATRMPDRPPAK
jgi:hypothetical protein